MIIHLQMDELACFAPGMIALGSSGYAPDEAKKFLTLAEEVNSPNPHLCFFLTDRPLRSRAIYCFYRIF